MYNRIAIVAVGYNRVTSLSRLLKSLNDAYFNDDDVSLIISIDKSDTTIVEDFADQFIWFHGKKIVDKHKVNLGLRNHMMSLNKWFDEYDALIILEDDIIVSPSFFLYVEQCFQKYQNCDYIAGLSLYSFNVNYQTLEIFTPFKDEHDVFFMNCAMSWGQIWLKKQWMEFYNWYIKNNVFSYSDSIPSTLYKWPESSWLKYHTRYCIENNKYFVYPYFSYSTNCGEIGTHHKQSNSLFQVVLQMGICRELLLPSLDNAVIYDGFFENKGLYESLNYSEQECCLDLNGMKNNVEKKRYWLTLKKCNYKIIKSYGLNYRPIEQNLFCNNIGNDIYLYDITQINKNTFNKKRYNIILYRFYITNILLFIKKYGILSILDSLISAFKKRLKK